MRVRVFKFICVLLGIFGVAILVGTPVAYFVGAMDKLSGAALTLKVFTSILRAIFLIMCIFVMSAKPKHAVTFAWLALVAYVAGASADMIYQNGIVNAAKNIMPVFYIMSAVHIMAALSLQLLAIRLVNQRENG